MKASIGAVAALTVVGGCTAVPIKAPVTSAPEPEVALSTPAAASKVALPAAFTQKGIAVRIDALWQAPNGLILGVTGTAKNVAAGDLSFCQIALAFLDREGAKLDDAKASTKSLKAGEVWEFQAALLHPSITDYAAVTPEKLVAIPVKNAKPELASLK